MEYVVTGLCVVFSGIIGILAFAYIDFLRGRGADESNENDDSSCSAISESSESPIETEKPAKSVTTIFRTIKQALTLKRMMPLAVGMVINLIVAIRLIGYDIALTTSLKIILSLSFLLAVLFIDWKTRKIPNLIILCMLGMRLVFLLPEYLLYKDDFLKILLASGIGLAGCFIIMLILSLITKGGIGMGDVKIISAIGFLSGIAISFYTLFLGMFVCMLFSLTLLAMKKKKMKDQVPFGPFVYIGYVMAVLIGVGAF